MNISIIIVNYKVVKEVINCISSIIKGTKNVKYEIIVVDNEGSGKLKQLLKKYKEVKYLDPNKNLGYGAGNNFGAKYASGEYLFILNPDTVVKPKAVEELYKFSKNKQYLGAVSPLLLDIANDKYSLQGTEILTPFKALFSLSLIGRIFSNNKILKNYYNKDWNKKNIREVDVLPGTAFMIKKSLYDDLGGFDENFFLYFEEFDLCKRIKEKGFKNYIITSAVIIHKWGLSTKQKIDKDQIFQKSRFYYFKKHFGLFKALVTEFFLRFNRNTLLLLISSFLFMALSLYRLSDSMSFMGDQAWFYMSARDLITYKLIPLVGIASSHVWLHQGPLWTYILFPFMYIFNFSPVGGAYLSIIINAFTIWAIYSLGKLLFERNTGILSAILYAFSPLVVLLTRTPYHTTPIPLFVTLYMLSIFKWEMGKKWHFALSFLYLGILYNLELATVSFFAIPILFLIFGSVRKTIWFKDILNKKIISASLILFLVPMIPVIYYDFLNGFSQTVKFGLWIGYKITSFILPLWRSNEFSASIKDIFIFLLNNYRELILPGSFILAMLILLLSLVNLFSSFKKRDARRGGFLILLWLLIGYVGIIASRTQSAAYLPMLSPALIILTALLFKRIFSYRYWFVPFAIFILIIFFNVCYLLKSDRYLSGELEKRTEIVSLIAKSTKGRQFSLIGKGQASQFRTFTMPYEYLLWYLYKLVPSQSSTNRYYIEEVNGKIILSK
jgi:GT2 family glycosyltransferase/4-amino-4-deoxy-L-arabinose transferase-like glycosyltransferase